LCGGHAAQHWLGVASDCVEVVRFDTRGDERVLHRFHSGQCLAEAAMFMAHARYPMQARAAPDCQVWRFSAALCIKPAKPTRRWRCVC